MTEAVKNDGLDFKSASAGPARSSSSSSARSSCSTWRRAGSKTIDVTLAGDFPEVRPQFVKVDAKRIHNAGLSPTGARAVFEARGEILTVPVEKGDVRNLTHTPAVAERDPAWSPDGKSIAYFSDESGEYELEIRDQNGMGEAKTDRARTVVLSTRPSGRPIDEDRLQRQAAEPLVRRCRERARR